MSKGMGNMADIEEGEADAKAPHARRFLGVRRPLYLLEDPWDALRNFSTSIFIMSSTTGLEGLLFKICPYFGDWAVDLGFAIFWVSTVFFVLSAVLLAGRIKLIGWKAVKALVKARDPDFFFFALASIAFTLIVEGFGQFMPHYFGYKLGVATVALWWVSWVFSLAMMLLLPFCLSQFSSVRLESVMPVYVLLAIPGCAVAAVGGEITNSIDERYLWLARHVAYATVITIGYVAAQLSIVIVIVTQRVLLRGFPPHFIVMSLFFPVAGMALLGDAFVELAVGLPLCFPTVDPRWPIALGSEALSAGVLLIGLAMFGFCIFLILSACCAIAFAIAMHRRLPFSPTFWGAAFPVGLTGLLAFRLGDVLNVDAFHIVGAGLSLISLTAWALIFTATLVYAYSGQLFIKPGTRHRGKRAHPHAAPNGQPPGGQPADANHHAAHKGQPHAAPA